MNTTFYFPHDFNAGQDYKIIALISKHSASGYGVYWRIIEMLHSDDSHTLPNNEMIWSVIAMTMNVPTKDVKNIIDTCIEFKLLYLDEGGLIYSNRVNCNIGYRKDKIEQRKNAGKMSALKKQQNTNEISTDVQRAFNERSTDAERMPNKGKERKGKESKGNNTYSDEYERMWIEYGRKGNKKDGFKHYQALTEAERQQAMMAIPAYFNTQPEPQYRKDIERYLAKKHWESFLSTSESGEVKVERIKILPNLANKFTFSLWKDIPKGTSKEERWDWYKRNREECSEVYQTTRKYNDIEINEYCKLPPSHELHKFIADYSAFLQNEITNA